MGDLDGALEACDEAIRLDPAFAAAWQGRGIVLFMRGELNGAFASYNEVISLDPALAPAWNGKGNVFYDRGDLDGALAAFSEAVRLDPTLAAAWNGKGNVFHDQGDLGGALLAYDKATCLDMTIAIAWNGKGNVLRDMGDLYGALAAYDEATRLDPTGVLPWHGKGTVLEATGQHSEAHEARLRAIAVALGRRNLDGFRVLTSLIQLWLRRGTAPLLCARIAAELGVHDAGLHALRGLSEAEDEAFGYGLAVLHAQQPGSASSARVLRALGLLAFTLGDPFEAIRHFDALDTEDDTDLLGQYYLVQCHDAVLDTSLADGVLSVALQQAEAVRRAPDVHNPETLYYAARLFWQREGQELKVLYCAHAAAERGFLPARYFELRVARRLGQDEMEDRLYRTLAEAERALHDSGRAEHGFLVPYQMPPLDFSNTAWLDEVVHAAHVTEVEEDVQQVYRWLGARRAEAQTFLRDGRTEDAAAVYDPLWDALADARVDVADMYAERQRVAVADQAIAETKAYLEDLAQADLSEREQRVRDWFPILYLDAGRYKPRDLENVIGEDIRQKPSRDFEWERHRDLALVLAARAKLPPDAVVRLTVFAQLKTPDPSLQQGLSKEGTRGVLASALGPALAAMLTPYLGLLGSAVAAGTSAMMAEIGVQFVQRLHAQGVSYSSYADYRDDFERRLFEFMRGADRDRLHRLLLLPLPP